MIRFVLALTLFFHLAAQAQTEAPKYYDERPDVLTVQPDPNGKRYFQQGGFNYSLYEKAAMAYGPLLAEIMTFFPDDEYYFLARDIEYLYDTARVLFQFDEVTSKRFHLLPVGRLNATRANIDEYLAQEGLTQANLQGRQALAIDSCCSGSIPKHIAATVRNRGVQVRGFLIETDDFPKSTLFKSMALRGRHIEDFPHYTGTANGFERDATGRLRVTTEGEEFHPAAASKLMFEIRKLYESADARRRFQDMREKMTTAYEYLKGGSRSRAAAIQALLSLRDEHNLPAQAFLDDAFLTNKRNPLYLVDKSLYQDLATYLMQHPKEVPAPQSAPLQVSVSISIGNVQVHSCQVALTQ
ncbi:MAG: hypothetical protein AB7F86_01630 [Bdellovibrionales bacterium]